MPNTTDVNCPLNITNKIYSSTPLKGFYFPLAILNCIIDSCLPVTSVGGSALLIAAVIKFPQLREAPSNLLLTSQAVSDLLIGLFVQPLIAVRQVTLLGHDNCLLAQRNFLKGFAIYWIHALLFSSCLNICLITVDRYICITDPLRYQTLVTVGTAVQAIIATWLLSFTSATLPALLTYNPETTILITTSRVVSVIPPLLLVFISFFCYFKMERIARRHKSRIRAQMNDISNLTKQDFKSTRTTVIMVGVIFLCYVPPASVILGLYASKNLVFLEAILPFLNTLAFLNSSINPLVYYARSRKIRRYVWKVFKPK